MYAPAKRAVGEVDEVQQAENDGQPDRDQEVDHPQAQAVENLEQIKIEHAGTLQQAAVVNGPVVYYR